METDTEPEDVEHRDGDDVTDAVDDELKKDDADTV